MEAKLAYEEIDYGIKFLVNQLKKREQELAQLQNYIDDLENQLNHETSVNENLQDMNIKLKTQIKKESNKVIEHPASIKTLSNGLRRMDIRVSELIDSLIFAIELIPLNPSVTGHIDRLRAVACKS